MIQIFELKRKVKMSIERKNNVTYRFPKVNMSSLLQLYERSTVNNNVKFKRHYQYNIDMAPNRTQLQSLTQGTNESFKEYAQKWRELAARVQPPMLEKEMIDMFMSTLQGAFYDRMVGSTSAGFSDLVMAGERIEAGSKMGKIQSTSSSSSSSGAIKKPFGGYVKKKEGEASAVYVQRSRPQYPQPRYPPQQHLQRQYPQQVNEVAIPVTTPPRP